MSAACSLPPLNTGIFSPQLSPVLQVVLVPEGSCYSSSAAAVPTWSRQTRFFLPSSLFILFLYITGSGRNSWKGGIKQHCISLSCPDTCISLLLSCLSVQCSQFLFCFPCTMWICVLQFSSLQQQFAYLWVPVFLKYVLFEMLVFNPVS